MSTACFDVDDVTMISNVSKVICVSTFFEQVPDQSSEFSFAEFAQFFVHHSQGA